MQRIAGVLIIGLLWVGPTWALNAHVVINTNFVRASEGAGIYLCHTVDSTYDTLRTYNASGLSFSPDGKQICFGRSGSLRIMNNDGTDERTLLSSGYTPSKGEATWTTNGIFWMNGYEIHRCLVDAPSDEMLYDFKEHPEKAVGSNIVGNQGLWTSGDGRRGFAWFKFDDGTLPLIEFNADFSQISVRYTHHWGHGNTMTSDGQYILMNWWEKGHDKFRVWSFEDNRQVDTAVVGHRILNWSSVNKAKNNDDYAVVRCTGDSVFILDWAHDGPAELVIRPDFTVDGGVGARLGGAWMGDLPDPNADAPHLSLDKSELTFEDSGTQAVGVTNTGVGTLGQVALSVSPAASWLAVQIQESGGNTQTIDNTVNTAGLDDGTYTTTVTVSGGGADNSMSYTVSLSVGGALLAPSGLEATTAGDSLKDVVLTWTDNSDGETGFEIERMAEGGSWAAVGTAGADDTSFTDPDLALGVYTYRVRAVDAASQSDYSAQTVVTVSGIAWVRLSEPVGGSTFAAGDTIRIRWTTNLVPQLVVKYSLNEGKTWETLNSEGGIGSGGPAGGSFTWVAPDVTTSTALVWVHEYGNTGTGAFSDVFTIQDNSGVAVRATPTVRREPSVRLLPDRRLALVVPGSRSVQLRVFDLRGTLVGSWRFAQGVHECRLPNALKAGHLIAELAFDEHRERWILTVK